MRLSHRLTLVAILLIATALRTLNLTGESLWRDEVDIVRFALGPAQEVLTSFTRTGFNGPFYIVLMRLWLNLAGMNDFALRYFSLLCGVGLVAVVFVLAKRLFGRRPALASAWLMAVSPVHIWYSGEGKMYTLQPLLLLVALYALIRVIGYSLWVIARSHSITNNQQLITHNQQPITKSWWLIFVIATSLAFYTHVLSPIFLVVAGAVFLVHWPRAKLHLKGALIALACLTVPYLPLLVWQAPTLLKGGGTGHTFVSLSNMAFVLLSDWTIGFGTNAPLFFMLQLSWVRVACIIFFIVIAALGLFRALLTAPRAALTVLAWLLLPMLAVFAISLRTPVFEPRYLLWCAPALYVFAGVGVGRLESKRLARRNLLLSNLQSLTKRWES